MLAVKPGGHGQHIALPAGYKVARIQPALTNDVLETPQDVVRQICNGVGVGIDGNVTHY